MDICPFDRGEERNLRFWVIFVQNRSWKNKPEICRNFLKTFIYQCYIDDIALEKWKKPEKLWRFYEFSLNFNVEKLNVEKILILEHIFRHLFHALFSTFEK